MAPRPLHHLLKHHSTLLQYCCVFLCPSLSLRWQRQHRQETLCASQADRVILMSMLGIVPKGANCFALPQHRLVQLCPCLSPCWQQQHLQGALCASQADRVILRSMLGIVPKGANCFALQQHCLVQLCPCLSPCWQQQHLQGTLCASHTHDPVSRLMLRNGRERAIDMYVLRVSNESSISL
jgi:hypothetical protein